MHIHLRWAVSDTPSITLRISHRWYLGAIFETQKASTACLFLFSVFVDGSSLDYKTCILLEKLDYYLYDCCMQLQNHVHPDLQTTEALTN
jgi:hypothetical protein